MTRTQGTKIAIDGLKGRVFQVSLIELQNDEDHLLAQAGWCWGGLPRNGYVLLKVGRPTQANLGEPFDWLFFFLSLPF